MVWEALCALQKSSGQWKITWIEYKQATHGDAYWDGSEQGRGSRWGRDEEGGENGAMEKSKNVDRKARHKNRPKKLNNSGHNKEQKARKGTNTTLTWWWRRRGERVSRKPNPNPKQKRTTNTKTMKYIWIEKSEMCNTECVWKKQLCKIREWKKKMQRRSKIKIQWVWWGRMNVWMYDYELAEGSGMMGLRMKKEGDDYEYFWHETLFFGKMFPSKLDRSWWRRSAEEDNGCRKDTHEEEEEYDKDG